MNGLRYGPAGCGAAAAEHPFSRKNACTLALVIDCAPAVGGAEVAVALIEDVAVVTPSTLMLLLLLGNTHGYFRTYHCSSTHSQRC